MSLDSILNAADELFSKTAKLDAKEKSYETLAEARKAAEKAGPEYRAYGPAYGTGRYIIQRIDGRGDADEPEMDAMSPVESFTRNWKKRGIDPAYAAKFHRGNAENLAMPPATREHHRKIAEAFETIAKSQKDSDEEDCNAMDADPERQSTWRVRYVNSQDKSAYIDVKAVSRSEAQEKAKKELGKDAYHIHGVTEMDSEDEEDCDGKVMDAGPGLIVKSQGQIMRRFKSHERVMARDYAAALVHKGHEKVFVDAAEMVSPACEDDEPEMDATGQGAIGSEFRKEEPEDTFLQPGERKYPVKKDGVYNKELLVSAAREARAHGHEDIAKKADSIREMKFGSAEGGAKADADRKTRFKVPFKGKKRGYTTTEDSYYQIYASDAKEAEKKAKQLAAEKWVVTSWEPAKVWPE